MIEAKAFCDAAKLAGFSLYTGVPCSYVKPFINFVIDAPDLTYIGATNEGDAVAIATGAELGGKRAIVMMQNSGLGNAVSPLTSLNAVFRIPVLMIVTLRGEPGGPHDEPQHELIGAITTQMLDTMNVAWAFFPQEVSEIAPAIEKAVSHMTKTGLPFCLVMKKDSVAPHKLATKPVVRQPAPGAVAAAPATTTPVATASTDKACAPLPRGGAPRPSSARWSRATSSSRRPASPAASSTRATTVTTSSTSSAPWAARRASVSASRGPAPIGAWSSSTATARCSCVSARSRRSRTSSRRTSSTSS